MTHIHLGLLCCKLWVSESHIIVYIHTVLRWGILRKNCFNITQNPISKETLRSCWIPLQRKRLTCPAFFGHTNLSSRLVYLWVWNFDRIKENSRQVMSSDILKPCSNYFHSHSWHCEINFPREARHVHIYLTSVFETLYEGCIHCYVNWTWTLWPTTFSREPSLIHQH